MLGILGGTFDPVHAGHLRLAERGSPPARAGRGGAGAGRGPGAPAVGRGRLPTSARTMLAAAVLGRCGLYVDGRELAGEGPRWTIDTLASFRAECARRPLCLLLGADQLRVLDTWRRWRELTDYAHLVAARRPGAGWPRTGNVSRWAEARRCGEPGELRRRPAGCVLMMDLPAFDVSSTVVRERCAAGRDFGDLVPEAVREYIQREKLYADGA